MEELVKKLYDNPNKFNYEVVKEIRKNKGKINNYLLEELDKNIINYNDKKFSIFVDYALFLGLCNFARSSCKITLIVSICVFF